MRSKLPDVPVLRNVGARIGAGHYNRVRIAMHHLGEPLRLMLPGMRSFQVIMEPRLWVCADRNLNQLPILAWADFSPSSRRSLADPVPCRILFYHPYANIVVRTVMDDIAKILIARLKRVRSPRRQAAILPFSHGG